jgi:transcriptional regulator with XRE-family HTH domain
MEGMPRPAKAGMAAAGRAVRAWRADRTQQEVAAQARINVDTLSDLESGRTWPRNKTLRAVEDALGRPRGELDRIAADTGRPREPAIPRDLLNAIRRELDDPAEQQRVIEAVERTLRGEPQPPNEPGEEDQSSAERGRRAGLRSRWYAPARRCSHGSRAGGAASTGRR